MKKKLIIAIDGYSSCGKSTFAKSIAKELNYLFIDSGAMYRAVTLYCMNNNLVANNLFKEEEIINRLTNIYIKFRYNPDKSQHETYLNGKNVEEEIRRIEVSSYVSVISSIKEVRSRMVELQREIGMFKGIVMDGRDIGTTVFPDAEIKIFMTASVKIRADRRYKELVEKGQEIDFDSIMDNISERDRIDSSREISPLRQADDAIILDNSNMTITEQMLWFRDILKEIEK